ncbi:MAG: hypothetical protein KDC92_00745 [Bacteroidetes bacterium]|nr:hypothetical protein [Bacteroidota bacterium]
MKKLTLTLALGLAILTLSAQNIGVTLSKGVSSMQLRDNAFKSSFNQSISIGVLNETRVQRGLNFTAGLNYYRITTGGSLLDKSGEYVPIDFALHYLEVPLGFEKDFYYLRRAGRRALFFRIGGGANITYRVLTENLPSKSNDGLGYGGQAFLQWVKPVTWTCEFGFGPTIKYNSTGSSIAPNSMFYGLKLDLRATHY